MSSHRALSLKFWSARRLPVLLQTESSECGLACLAMVTSHWGHRIDLAEIRRRFSVSLKGATLKSLISMASALHLRTRPLKVGLASLKNLSTPCVLHWDMNHFVVLKSAGRNSVVIHDPAVGERRLPMSEVSKHFTGIALELGPTAEFKEGDERRQYTLRSLMGRIVGFKRSLAQLLLLGVSLQVLALLAPFYIQWVVDEALVAGDQDLITVLGLGFLLLVLVQAALSAVRSWVTTTLSTSLNFQWLGNAFAHLMRLPLPYFEKRHLGDIVSRFNSIQVIQQSLTSQFVEGVIDGLLVVSTLVVMFLYSAKLSIVALVAVGIYGLLRVAMFSALRNATTERIVHAAKQQTHFLESARGVQSVRLFGRVQERRIGWMNMLADQFNADLRVSRLSISYQSANMLLFGAERVIVIWLAALAALNHQFSVGMLFAFISYKDQFSQRTAALIDKLFDLRMLRLHGERVADIMHTEPEEDNLHIEIDPDSIIPTVEFRDVSFRYADGEPLVLNALNLTIPPGQSIAITGPSGCGKTTLIKLLLGLLEPTSGEILVGGEKLAHLGRTNYRSIIGSVMQEDHLFSGSIADNISFFDGFPDQARIEAAATQAAIHAEISGMPMGYSTLVGDIGSGLSGGQQQRILLARALYRQPKMVVLDEATSHLDIGNEQLVNAAIRQIAMTRVIVAHRPETIAMAQRVVVLEAGSIVRDLEQHGPQDTAAVDTAVSRPMQV